MLYFMYAKAIVFVDVFADSVEEARAAAAKAFQEMETVGQVELTDVPKQYGFEGQSDADNCVWELPPPESFMMPVIDLGPWRSQEVEV